MALVKPDFTEVAEELTPGTYKGIIKRGELKYWDAEQTKPYVSWEIETTGESEPKNNGRRIFHKTSTSGKGAFMLQKFFRAATGEALTGQFDTEKLVGRQVMVEVADGVNRQTGEKTGYIEVKNVKPVSN